jgi:hypothetical protein
MQQRSDSSLKQENTSHEGIQKDQQTPETQSKRSTETTIASNDSSEEDPKLIPEYKYASNL